MALTAASRRRSKCRSASVGRPGIGPKITFHVPEWADREMRRIARDEGRSFSDVRREAVERGLTVMLSAAVL